MSSDEETAMLPTHLGHLWLVLGVSGNCYGIVGVNQPTTAVNLR